MASLCNVATFLLGHIDSKESNQLALVHPAILSGPPVAYTSRSVRNHLPPRSPQELPLLRDFIDRLTVLQPNLHTLSDSLRGMDLHRLELAWIPPHVRATTPPPLLDLAELVPHLKELVVREAGFVDYCLPLFSNLRVPLCLRALDLSGLHVDADAEGADFTCVVLAARRLRATFCACCSRLTAPHWEGAWRQVPCPRRR